MPASVTTSDLGPIALSVPKKELKDLVDKIKGVLPEVVEDSLEDFADTLALMAAERTPLGWRWDKASKSYKRSNVVAPGKYMKHPNMWQINKKGKKIEIASVAKYAAVLEKGAYPTPSGQPPKAPPWEFGWRVEGGYSKQAPGGILGPLLENQASPITGTEPKPFDRALKDFERSIMKKLERILK